MRYFIVAISMLLCAAIPAHAQVSVGIRSHDVSISFHVSAYPRLVAIPGYPVYYDPRANSNYFFYDGLYWVFEDDNWYSSAWYDGPWDLVDPEYVPLFVLRVPVRYYRHRPTYFSGWSLNFAPRWGDHWGHDWERHHSGWDRWDRHSIPRAAPLPSYQARYSGSRYPRAPEQQYSIQSKSYRYQPREAVTRQYFQQRAATTGTRTEAPQQAPSPQPRVKEQAQTRQQTRSNEQAQTRRTRADGQAQAQKQTRATEQAQARQQTRASQQAAQRRPPANEQAQAQRQARANQQAQAQQRSRSNREAQAQQQTHARQQAQAEQQSRAREQAPARQQQPSRRKEQVQQGGPQQRAAAPKTKGSANRKQPQPKKEKDDKQDGGGQSGQ